MAAKIKLDAFFAFVPQLHSVSFSVCERAGERSYGVSVHVTVLRFFPCSFISCWVVFWCQMFTCFTTSQRDILFPLRLLSPISSVPKVPNTHRTYYVKIVRNGTKKRREKKTNENLHFQSQRTTHTHIPKCDALSQAIPCLQTTTFPFSKHTTHNNEPQCDFIDENRYYYLIFFSSLFMRCVRTSGIMEIFIRNGPNEKRR